MEHVVDLDDLARRLGPLAVEWRRSAMVGPLTWRDEVCGWPHRIVDDRDAVGVPESVGIRLRRGDDEMEICVWTGGWADVIVATDGEVKSRCPQFGGVDAAFAAVARIVEDFLA